MKDLCNHPNHPLFPDTCLFPNTKAKHMPYEVCDCPSPKAPGRPYHCAAQAPQAPRSAAGA